MTEPTMSVEDVDRLIEFLLSLNSIEALTLADMVNRKMGRSARRRLSNGKGVTA